MSNGVYPTESYAVPCGIAGSDLWVECFVWHAVPFTINAANNKRWAWIEARREWREAFTLMAKGCEPLAWCNITVDHLCATRRKVDVGACMPSFKAALDGVVNAGVLIDDGPDFVRSVTFNAPVYIQGTDSLIVTLTGPVASTTN